MSSARSQIAKAVSEHTNIYDIEPEVLVINFEMWEQLIKEDKFSSGVVENLQGLDVIVINDYKESFDLFLRDDLKEAKEHFNKSPDIQASNRTYVKTRVRLTDWDNSEMEFEPVKIPKIVVDEYFKKFS